MTVGKIYYLSSILGKINSATIIGVLITLIAIVCLIFSLAFYKDNVGYRNIQEDEDCMNEVKRYKKNIAILICVCFLLTSIHIVTPAKEDFIIQSLTSEYKAEDIYKMTKEEIKSSIDYLFENIKELKE